MVFIGLSWLLKPIPDHLKFEYILPSPRWVGRGHCKLTQQLYSTGSHSDQVECIPPTKNQARMSPLSQELQQLLGSVTYQDVGIQVSTSLPMPGPPNKEG